MNNHTICVIDDNEAVCDALKFLFETLYHTSIKIFNDPMVFLDELNSDWLGCLIIDLHMPSMTGIELISQLKKKNAHLKIIIMSGHGAQDIALKSLNAGADAFINKPFKTQKLHQLIKSLMPTGVIK